MSAVVTDTHALIWYLFEPKRLSSVARTALLQAEANPGVIYVPAISVVEARYLVEKDTMTEAIFKRLDSLLDSDTAPAVFQQHPVAQNTFDSLLFILPLCPNDFSQLS